MTHDSVQLQGMVFYGFHGANLEEKILGQRFVVDLEARCNLRAAGISDALNDTVSYSALYHVVKDVVEGDSHNLLESLADTIAQHILDGFQVDAVRVKVMKPAAPIKGSIIGHAAVEIVRESQR